MISEPKDEEEECAMDNSQDSWSSASASSGSRLDAEPEDSLLSAELPDEGAVRKIARFGDGPSPVPKTELSTSKNTPSKKSKGGQSAKKEKKAQLEIRGIFGKPGISLEVTETFLSNQSS
jgi:hypothetical protein